MSFYLNSEGKTVLMIYEACGLPNSPSPNSSSALQAMSGKTRMNSVYSAFVGS